LDLTQIRYFLALAKALNFTKAAEMCNVTQPALTKSIQRLEQELGGPLLLREGPHSQLTELGETMLPLLRITYESAEAARLSAQQFHRQDVARLRIGLGTTVEPNIVAPLLRQVIQRFPGVEITLREGDSTALNDWLLGSQVDVLLSAEAERLPDRAKSWKLFADRLVALLPPDHQLAACDPLPAEHLRQQVLIGRVTEVPALETRYGAAEMIRHRGATEAQVQTLVATGAGIAISTACRARPDSIVSRLLDPPEAQDVVVATIPGRPLSRAADAFLRLARARDWDA
jgi:DNA-binding transcriptional LysR family regulator